MKICNILWDWMETFHKYNISYICHTVMSAIFESQSFFIEQLVEQASARDIKAFEQLYQKTCGPLYSIIFRITQDKELSNDLLQDSFIRIWKNLETYDASKARFFTWAARIARNTTIDYLRSKSFKATAIQKHDVYEYYKEKTASMPEDKKMMQEVIMHLDVQYRTIIDLVYIWGFTQDEVSKMLNIPLGTVKSRARTAILQLRKALNIS